LEARAGNVLEARAERIANIERVSDVSNISELQAALTATKQDSGSGSGVVSVRPVRPASKKKLMLVAGLAVGVFVLVSGIFLIRMLRAPDAEVEAVAMPESTAVPKPTAALPAAEPVETAQTEPSSPEQASAAPKPTSPPARRVSRKVPSTAAAKSGKKNPFEGLGGRL
jgi:hypothetical protein